jgi:hypothetical protein
MGNVMGNENEPTPSPAVFIDEAFDTIGIFSAPFQKNRVEQMQIHRNNIWFLSPAPAT